MQLRPASIDRRPCTVLLGLALCCTWPAAWAGSSLKTEDANVIDAGRWELDMAAGRSADDPGELKEMSVQLARGIGLDSQVALDAAWADGEDAELQTLTLGGKTRLWSQGSASARRAQALTLTWALASEKETGAGWRHTGSEVMLAYSRKIRSGHAFHANLGHARAAGAGAYTTSWGLAFEHAGQPMDFGTLAPMAEVFGNDHEAPWWNLGLRWSTGTRAFSLNAAYGRQMDEDRTSWLSIGAQFAF